MKKVEKLLVARKSEYKYFVIFDKSKLSKEEFLLKCKIRENSFASQLMLKIYYTLFNTHVDLELEYKKYYLKEYDKFESFLYNKYIINFDDIQYLTRNKKEKEKIYYIDLLKQPDYGIRELINADFINKLNCIFMEEQYENKD